MKFFLLLEEEGGCDYTLGCGYRMVELKATSYKEAAEEASTEMASLCYDSRRYKAATIFEVAGVHKLNVGQWHAWFDQDQATKRQQAEEEKERQELERLQAKYK